MNSRFIKIYGVSAVALIMSFIFGAAFSVYRIKGEMTLAFPDDTRSRMPTVELTGIQDGELSGSLQGDVSLFLRGKQVLSQDDGTFSVPADSFFINYVTAKVPPGMQFVSSKRGKKYYSVSDPSGERIVPANRIYFRSAKEAEAAGYVR
jgi:hypothetical protein